MNSNLTNRTCNPVEEGTDPLKGNALDELSRQLPDGWNIVDEHHLQKEFTFDNFRQALDFTNRVGEVAEKEDHHPDIYLTWGVVEIRIWTHQVDGLTDNDFVFAAKADAVRQP